jgi:CheY-like chemotaxis protein
MRRLIEQERVAFIFGSVGGYTNLAVRKYLNDNKIPQLFLALGYTVLQADGAAEALRQLDSNAEVDLLFTDIVMPETDGRKLAEEACKRRPSLEVLFTTGYTRNAIVHGGVLDPGVNLIVKPYSIEMLGRKLREILDLEEKRKTPPSRSDY